MVRLGGQGTPGVYRQWEEDNIPPQVVFEILSREYRVKWLKKLFYLKHGVRKLCV
ncbi:hypothetical protein [Cylindrospermopsis raciborskii]|uniref:hypothetical protein n=1 Tax=Cylindrospermopsis raciborskii TaxID=77022 RepID=UPI002ED79DC9